MHGTETLRAAPASRWQRLFVELRQNPLFWIGVFVIAAPTMFAVARHAWGTEESAHGPIVLATGAWLIWTILRERRPPIAPPHHLAWLALLAPALLLFLAARITGLVEVQALALYGIGLGTLYAVAGAPMMRALWFPLIYLLFLIPFPQSLIDSLTQPLKIGISEVAVGFLAMLGYPIGGSGVTIMIGQYELQVAAACAGLNSLISLTAIGIFYIYILHRANWRYVLLLMAVVIPVAIAANFVRVLILILVTYYLGEAAAQGFVHDFAGLLMFAIAVLMIFLIDTAAAPLRTRLARSEPSARPETPA